MANSSLLNFNSGRSLKISSGKLIFLFLDSGLGFGLASVTFSSIMLIEANSSFGTLIIGCSRKSFDNLHCGH